MTACGPLEHHDQIDREGISLLPPADLQRAITIESLAKIDRDFSLTGSITNYKSSSKRRLGS
jgi:hypothetical protein